MEFSQASADYDGVVRERDHQTISDLIDQIKSVCFNGDYDFPRHGDDFTEQPPVSARPAFVKRNRTNLDKATDLPSWIKADGWKSDKLAETPDAETAIKIRELGEQFLAEAWHVFGEKKEELRNGLIAAQDDPNKQLAIVREAVSILNEISKKNAHPDDKRAHYNPVRVSPKFIGEYPNTKLDPTCLAGSIIMASLFKQANIPNMTAGVAFISSDYLPQEALGANRRHYDATRKDSCYSRAVDHYTGDESHNFYCGYGDGAGYHCATYAKIGERWTGIDVLFRQVQPTNCVTSEKIEEAYRNTQDNKHIVGDAYLIQIAQHAKYYRRLINKSLENIQTTPPEFKKITSFLADLDYESVPMQIYERFIEKSQENFSLVSNTSRVNLAMSDIWHAAMLDRCDDDTSHRSDLADLYFYYYSDGDDIMTFIDRCRNDQAYRERRATDIIGIYGSSSIVLGIALWIEAIRLLNARKSFSADKVRGEKANFNDHLEKHVSVELQDSAEKIGFAVLNDFADALNIDISPRTWLSLSASDVALTAPWPSETPKKCLEAGELDELLYNNIAEMALRDTYFRNNKTKYFEAWNMIPNEP